MKIIFNPYYFVAFLCLLLIESCIAIFLKDGFIRYTVGDFLAVMLLYCFFKSFIKAHNLHIAITTLIIAYCIELFQLTDMVRYGMLKEYKWIGIILGSHFSIGDLIAYSLGTVSILYLDTYILHLKSQKHESTI